MKNTQLLLSVIAAALVGLFLIAWLDYQSNHESPVEKISNSVKDAGEEIKDEIDDHTTSK